MFNPSWAHHHGAGPGNLRPVFIVKQQICVCGWLIANALWHRQNPRGTWGLLELGDATALGELLVVSWDLRMEGERKRKRRRRRGKAARAFAVRGSSRGCAHGQGRSCLVVTCSPGKAGACFAAKAAVWLQVCPSPPPALIRF